jgi:regulator of protease activity HflC (stomatin/prohibitin superfamily)
MALPNATDLFLEKLARLRRVSGWTAVLVALPVCLVTFANGLVHGAALGEFGSPWLTGYALLLLPNVGTFGALVLLANFALWRMLAWREKTLRRTLRDGTAPTLRVPWFGTRIAPTVVVWQHVIALLFGAALIAWWRRLAGDEPLGGDLPAWYTRLWDGKASEFAAVEREVRLYLAGAHVVLAAACALVATYFASVDTKLAPEARGFAAWLRLATWVLALSAAHLFAVVFEARVRLEFLVPFIEGLALLLWIELLLRGLATAWARFYTGAVHPGASVWTDAVVPRLLGTTFNPVKSLFTVAAEGFGIDLRGTWALEYMRRSLVPIGALLVFVGWLSTALHVVPFTHVGVLERFGARPASSGDHESGVLEPGLHVLWPWPIDRVRSIELTRVRTLPVGMERPIEGASMLWTVAHAEEEFRLVLGGGDDLLTVNAMLHWRPSDPLAFAYSVANPEQALSEIAGRVIFERTASRTLEEVLSGNVEVLAREFTDGIRAAVTEANLGIEIVDLAVLALHPPRDVAADYQSVVSAQIDAEKLRIDAYSRQDTERIRGAAEAYAVTSDAHGWAAEELARAGGQIAVFGALAGARASIGPEELFDLVLRLERMGQVLNGLAFVVLDRRLEEHGAAWWALNDR